MSSRDVPTRNRAERRLAAKSGKARAAGAALTAGSAALAMTAAWVGTGLPAAGAATTLHVTTTADAGAGSLRDQITAAASGDTIVFEVTGTITLATEISFNKDLIITGPGASALTVSGGDASGIFDISGTSAVTISGVTIAHASADDGGAIDTTGSLALNEVVFDNNYSSDDGGAIQIDGTLAITNSSFTNNTADDWGGAILVTTNALPVSISGSTFSGNEAGGKGGGLAIENRDASTIDSSTFSDNSAEGGGGIEIYGSGPTSVTGSTFTGNHANDGDGGAVDLYQAGAFSIASSTVSGNDSTDQGGGLNLYEVDGQVSIAATTISGNSSESGGGGVYAAFLHDGFNLTDSTISGNHTAAWGGGLYLGYTYSFVNVANTTISGNSADAGGGGAQLWGAHLEQTVTVTDTTLSGNQASGSGGGGWVQWGVAGPTTFANSTISGNTASDQGGGLYFYGFYGLSVEMSTVTGNTSGASTGGVYLGTSTEVGSAASGGHHARSADANAASGGRGSDEQAAREPRVHGAADTVHAAAVASAEITGSIIWGNSGNDVGEEANITFAHDLLGTIAAGIVATDGGGNVSGDPLLGPLQNNGGATETHALLPGSPAIDAGPDPVPDFPGNEFDQRGAGFPRIVGPGSDIGAFEVQPTAPEAINLTPRFTG